MNEYHKIDTLFARDMIGSRKLILGEYRNAEVEYLANNQWEFTEKIDGTNIRIIWDGHGIEFRGRTDKANIPTPLLEMLHDKFDNVATEEMFEQVFGEKEVIIYGEGYGPKIQSGGLYRDTVSFIAFDIAVNDTFLSRADFTEITRGFDIDRVPVIFFGTISQAVDYVLTKPVSTLSPRAQSEGVVGRPLVELLDKRGKRIIVKVKVEDFV